MGWTDGWMGLGWELGWLSKVVGSLRAPSVLIISTGLRMMSLVVVLGQNWEVLVVSVICLQKSYDLYN